MKVRCRLELEEAEEARLAALLKMAYVLKLPEYGKTYTITVTRELPLLLQAAMPEVADKLGLVAVHVAEIDEAAGYPATWFEPVLS